MFGKTIWLSEFLVTGSSYQDLILLHFYLQMLNDINVKPSLNSLRCKYQLKPQLKKKIFWNKQKSLNKELIMWSGLAR